MADETLPDLSKSSPPRAPLTDFEVAVMLHKIKWELSAISEKLGKAEQNDERFSKMEHEFRFVKWAAGIAVGAAIVAVVTGIAGKVSFRISDSTPPPNTADRMGSDRVAPPRPALVP